METEKKRNKKQVHVCTKRGSEGRGLQRGKYCM
jgi:hypothetical protein